LLRAVKGNTLPEMMAGDRPLVTAAADGRKGSGTEGGRMSAAGVVRP